MPAFGDALKELGYLIGLFKANGDVDWAWFDGPVAKALAALPAERERIGAFIRALLDRAGVTGSLLAGTNWEPIVTTNNVGLGLAWSASNNPQAAPLQLGLGVKADLPISGQQIDLAAVGRLIEIDGQTVTPILGQVKLGGAFPVPSFLAKGELTAEVLPEAPNPTNSVTVSLAATNQQAQLRQLDYPIPDTEIFAWDAARLAVFILRAWIKQRADANDTFFKRVNDHIFPMMGDPAGAIAAFPLVAEMKTPPNFDAWRDSVLSTDNDAAGALTFLWHLRAVLTGNESPGFLNGSYFFPLSGAIQSGTPPTLADAIGNYQQPTGTTGAWVGLHFPDPPGPPFTLVIDLETTTPVSLTCRIPLVSYDSTTNTFGRPTLDNSWTTLLQQISALGTQGLQIGSERLTAIASGAGFRLSLFRTTVTNSGFIGFDGDYDFAVYLETGESPQFILGTPTLDIQFPPHVNDHKKLLSDIALWALKAAAPQSGDPHFALSQLIITIGELVSKAVTDVNALTPADALNVLTKVVGVAGQGQKLKVDLTSDASVTLELKDNTVSSAIEFGPIADPSIPISVGTLKGGLVINPATSPTLDGFTLGFEDLRLSNTGAGSGIVASLIPDMRQFSGFRLAVEYTQQKLKVTGGGKIPIQRTLGPLEIAALLVDIREQSFAVGLDLGLQLAAIKVAAYELGLRFNFTDGSVEPFLHGLGLSMDTGVVKLAGFFAEVENGDIKDYVGGASVSVAGYFELSAIGGYTQLPDNSASLFIFASLVAPLGGPPWFFLTGVAGGFGYNRSLPAPGLLLDHPFLKVMRGDITISGNVSDALKELSVLFAASLGNHWIAAGIQFTAFGFINGKVVVSIAFGNTFSLTVLGMASFGINPLAYFEIGIEATADEEKFLLRARLSPNSYVIHPDIFSLQGDFALGAWYKEPHKGDFLFSIGGYHPLFTKPEHYPELMRVGCKALVYNFVHLSVEVFFCCTPQALMAGAKASLWAEFAGIAAGLDVYVDVLMKWDPFFLRARLGVHIWFEFFGRHEVGVDLDIWTPDFGGIATIDLALVEFDVDFGSSLAPPPPPSLADFLTKQIGVPAKPWNDGARTAAFSTKTAAGLFRVEFLTGRSGKEPPDKDDKQEGLDAASPVRLAAEWSFLVRTRLPLGEVNVTNQPPVSFSGKIDLPLCSRFDLPSQFTVSAFKINDAKRSWLADYFPAANFGDPVPEAQGSARDTASKLKTDHASIPLIEGMIVEYQPILPTNLPEMTAPSGEPSDPGESYPIPLGGAESGPSLGVIKSPYTFAGVSSLSVQLSNNGNRRDTALADLGARKKSPLLVLVRGAEVQRFTKVSAAQTFSASMASGVPVMAPPQSPVRPAEMFGVQLRVLPIRTNEPLPQRRQMETVQRAKSLKETVISPRGGVRGKLQTTLSVAAGRATQIEFTGGGVNTSHLRLIGAQTVRVIVLSRGGAVIMDTYQHGGSTLPVPSPRGVAAITIPANAAQVLLIGEGMTKAPGITGIERESILLAIGSRQFAGHGCIITVSSYFDLDIRPLDSLPGVELLAHASTLRIAFTAPVRGEGALILKLVPTVEHPAPAAEQVRWRGNGAQLRSLFPVISTERVALVMSVRAATAWSVDLDVGPEWRLEGIVFTPHAARTIATELQDNPHWDLIDDAMPVHPRGLATSISLEANA